MQKKIFKTEKNVYIGLKIKFRDTFCFRVLCILKKNTDSNNISRCFFATECCTFKKIQILTITFRDAFLLQSVVHFKKIQIPTITLQIVTSYYYYCYKLTLEHL